jgi:hypothetical protein
MTSYSAPRQYLPAADGRIVMVGRTSADVMSLLEARLHLIFVERLASNVNPIIAKEFTTGAIDLAWAIGEVEARAPEENALLARQAVRA